MEFAKKIGISANNMAKISRKRICAYEGVNQNI